MIINYTECENIGGNDRLFRDLIQYKTVDEYLTAIVNAIKAGRDRGNYEKQKGEPFFLPLTCGVQIDDNKLEIICDFDVKENADDIIKKVKKCKHKKLISDTIKIEADYFEAELFFHIKSK